MCLMNSFGHQVGEKSALMDYVLCSLQASVCVCVWLCILVCVFTPDVCQSERSLGILVFWEQLTVTSGAALALLWIFIYFPFNHVFVDHLKKSCRVFCSEWESKTQRVSLVNIIRAILSHKDIANSASVLLIDFVIFVSLFFVISLRDSLPAQLWRLGKCLAGGNTGTAWSLQLCLCVSILFVRTQASVSERLTRFFFLSVPSSAPGWLHRAPLSIALLPDKRVVRTVPAVFVKVSMNLQKEQQRREGIPQESWTLQRHISLKLFPYYFWMETVFAH